MKLCSSSKWFLYYILPQNNYIFRGKNIRKNHRTIIMPIIPRIGSNAIHYYELMYTYTHKCHIHTHTQEIIIVPPSYFVIIKHYHFNHTHPPPPPSPPSLLLPPRTNMFCICVDVLCIVYYVLSPPIIAS